MLQEISPGVYVGNVGDFGSADALHALNIGLVILPMGSKGFPHANDIIAIAATIHDHGNMPAWAAKQLAGLVQAAIDNGMNVAVCDEAGGATRAAYVLAAHLSEATPEPFEDAVAALKLKVPNMRIPTGLEAHGKEVWPKA